MALGSTSIVLSHWYKLIDGLQASTGDLYARIEKGLEPRQIPDAKASRVAWQEAGTFSASREYLRMQRGKHVMDICGAPFGNGFFISWWLAEARPSAVLPTVGALGVIMFFMYEFGWYGLIALLAVFVGIGAFISTAPEEEWVSYLLVVPVLGALWERFFTPATYYRIDTALMFQTAVHAEVLAVIDGMTTAKGIRALSEDERKPILRDFFKR